MTKKKNHVKVTVPLCDIEWAIAHLKKHGETDILPDGFELDHVSHDHASVAAELANVDVATYQPTPPTKVPTPKAALGFRITSIPDLLDNVLFTALIKSIAPLIEKARVPRRRKIVCSYRIAPSANGNFFDGEYGYHDFIDKSTRLAQPKVRSHVLKTDISDFYNQISHHRIENNLEAASVDRQMAKIIEMWLFAFASNQHSQGIPVGPSSSIVLAELALVDVDNHLLSSEFLYARYVDDFHVFCKSREDCVNKLHAMTEYLHNTHRLAINASKTSISSAKKFVKKVLLDPQEEVQRKNVRQIDRLIREKWSPYGPEDDEIEITDKEKNLALRRAMSQLIRDIIASDEFPLGLARYVLRWCKRLRTSMALKNVCRRVDRFIPVFRDVYNYWSMFLKKNPKHPLILAAVKHLMKDSRYRKCMFTQWWVLELLYRYRIVTARAAFAYCEACHAFLRDRYKPLLAATFGRLDLIRSYKETWPQYCKAARRSIIKATSGLPSDERVHWLSKLQITDDPLAKRLVRHLKARNSRWVTE